MSTHISILTVFEQLYKPFLQTSLIHHAQEKGIIDIQVNSFFSYVEPGKRIDAPTFGPGAGMLIRPVVVETAIEDKECLYGPAFRVFFSPQGKKLDQQMLTYLAKIVQKKSHLLLVSARYEGMDARVEEYYADLVLSVGDFVLMGGDLPAMVFLEGILRLLPGVVGKEESVEKESFTGPFVDFPVYTQPVEWKGYLVPDIVRSGNHAAINKWRMEQAACATVLRHFGWLRKYHLVTSEQRKLIKKFIPPHYILLVDNEVIENEEGAAIVLRDIAQVAIFYGLKNFFLVLSLTTKQKKLSIKDKINAEIKFCETIDEAVNMITMQHDQKPLIVALTSDEQRAGKQISFYDQSLVWESGRPVLFVFNKNSQKVSQIAACCDFLLPKPSSFTGKGQISLSSLVSVVFDRWLGSSPQ